MAMQLKLKPYEALVTKQGVVLVNVESFAVYIWVAEPKDIEVESIVHVAKGGDTKFKVKTRLPRILK